MTQRNDIVKLYHKRQIISVDTPSWTEYVAGRSRTLEIRIDGEWLDFAPPIKDYMEYSHTLSPRSMLKYYPQVWNKYLESRKGSKDGQA